MGCLPVGITALAEPRLDHAIAAQSRGALGRSSIIEASDSSSVRRLLNGGLE